MGAAVSEIGPDGMHRKIASAFGQPVRHEANVYDISIQGSVWNIGDTTLFLDRIARYGEIDCVGTDADTESTTSIVFFPKEIKVRKTDNGPELDITSSSPGRIIIASSGQVSVESPQYASWSNYFRPSATDHPRLDEDGV